eukprot:TRINITY_DN8790_c0_g2_i1.p1 TRINITY_DN8790_c0_g2~~TRINITY_DN8790_c0_g2_i1.p1  ORF type:complete len:211 (-),score=18.65 TRINITY_DN8790_c0_g2_i1:572-1204(-)
MMGCCMSGSKREHDKVDIPSDQITRADVICVSLLASPQHVIIAALFEHSKSDHGFVRDAVLQILHYHHHQMKQDKGDSNPPILRDFMRMLIHKEVKAAKSDLHLFRAFSPSHRVLSEYLMLAFPRSPLLRDVILPFLEDINNDTKMNIDNSSSGGGGGGSSDVLVLSPYEVDPYKVSEGQDAHANAQRLEHRCRQILDAFLAYQVCINKL